MKLERGYPRTERESARNVNSSYILTILKIRNAIERTDFLRLKRYGLAHLASIDEILYVEHFAFKMINNIEQNTRSGSSYFSGLNDLLSLKADNALSE